MSPKKIAKPRNPKAKKAETKTLCEHKSTGGGGSGDSSLDYLLKYMPVGLTGIRVGEVVEGIPCKDSQGGVMTMRRSLTSVTTTTTPLPTPAAATPVTTAVDDVLLFPPMQTYLNTIWKQANEAQLKEFFTKIRRIPFFAQFPNDVAIRTWLTSNQSSKMEMNLGEHGNLLLKFSGLPIRFTTGEINLSEDEQLELLSQEQPYFNFYAKIQKRNQGKTFLTLSSKWWTVSLQSHATRRSGQFDGWIINLFDSRTAAELRANDVQVTTIDRIPHSFEGQAMHLIGFYTGHDQTTSAISIITAATTTPIPPAAELAYGYIKILPPSGLKSLIQKIIRFQPKFVKLGGGGGGGGGKQEDILALDLLTMACKALATHPGSFNPNAGKGGSFSSGLEGLCKRLAVIAVEDSKPADVADVASLMWGAYICRRIAGWKPPPSLLAKWISIARGLYEQSAYLHRDTTGPPRLLLQERTLNNHMSALEQCTVLLGSNFLGSMEFDRKMFGYLSIHYINSTRVGSVTRPKTMPIYHCVDHHWAPLIAYTIDRSLVKAKHQAKHPSKPFKGIYEYLFENLTGVNVRKIENLIQFFQNRKHEVKHIRRGQEVYWRLYTKHLGHPGPVRIPLQEPPNLIKFNHSLHLSWLSGLVGEIPSQDPQRKNIINCLRIDRLEDVVPMVKLTGSAFRGKSEEVARKLNLSTQIEDEERARTREILMDWGAPLDRLKEVVPHPKFIGTRARLMMKEDETASYVVQQSLDSKEVIPWEDFRHLTVFYPAQSSDEIGTGRSRRTVLLSLDNPTDAYARIGDGVAQDHKNLLLTMIHQYSQDEMNFVLRYVDTYDLTVVLPKLMRDGSGETESADIKLVDVHRFMLQLSLLYPAIVRTKGIAKFQITSLPAYRTIISQVRRSTMDEMIIDTAAWGQQLEDNAQRSPMSHQIDSLQQMKKTHVLGIRGHFIWIPVGMGKTFIVLSYLRYLKLNDALPAYIIYTLPPSAMATVVNELILFQMKIHVLDPTKANRVKHNLNVATLDPNGDHITFSSGCQPQPHCINLIEHDHVRNCATMLGTVMSQSVFIMDEIHNAITQATQRTKNFMLLAQLSQEFIGMTGTAVINNDVYQLMPWMKLIVPYTLSPNNYQTSLTTMIAKKVNTGNRVHPEEIEVQFSMWPNHIWEAYADLVPLALHGRNPHFTDRDLRAATEICYDILDSFMVRKTMDLVKEGIYVMLVARDHRHQDRLCNLLMNSEDAPNPKYVLILGHMKSQCQPNVVDKLDSINLTAENLHKTNMTAYKVVLVPQQRVEGYSLTYLTAMVRAPYPSNQSKREQMEGRINRLDLTSKQPKDLYYYTYHTGITSLFLQKHKHANNLADALRIIAQEIQVSSLLSSADSKTM